MVYIFAAHKGEVEHLIKKLSLGKRKTSFPFLQYEGEEILLTITGQGQINASVSVAATLQEEKAKKGDLLLSLGSAAAILGRNRAAEDLLGRWFWIQKLEQQSTGRCFYPDLLYKLDFPEAKLLTGDKILELSPDGDSGILEEKLLLYDMESAAVFQAANFYLAPEDFFFLRCVTDFGVNPGEKQILSLPLLCHGRKSYKVYCKRKRRRFFVSLDFYRKNQ